MRDYRNRPDPFHGVDNYTTREVVIISALWIGVAFAIICLGALFAAVRP